jgi:PEP-CTERM motif
MHRIGRFVVGVGLFCLADATHVSADPIVISSGFLLVTGPTEVGSISIAGTQGFSLDARVAPREGRVDVFHLECDPICLPGSTISLGAFQGGPSFNGTATLAGNSYQLSGSINDPAGVFLEFFGSATLPALQNSLRVNAPFTAMGGFFLPGDLTPMSGAGVVSLWLSPQSSFPGIPAGWVVDQIRYDFGDPAPIPEPATVTLLGIGLAAIALRARIRGKERAESRVTLSWGPRRG